MSASERITFPAPTANWGMILDPNDPALHRRRIRLSTGELVTITSFDPEHLAEESDEYLAELLEEDDAMFAQWHRECEEEDREAERQRALKRQWSRHAWYWIGVGLAIAGSIYVSVRCGP